MLDGIDLAFELGEDLLDVLADDVGQDVEAAAVGHADDDLVDVVGGGALQNLFQDGERGFAAFEREALLADEARVQEVLELFARRSGCAGCAGASRGRAASGWLAGSMRCCSQRFCSGTWMFMYSQPILPQ